MSVAPQQTKHLSLLWRNQNPRLRDGDRLTPHRLLRILEFVQRMNQDLQWLCLVTDTTWPKQSRPGQSLINLLDHGIGVSSAHRVLTDCQLLAELFNCLETDELNSLLNQAIRPKAPFKAWVGYDGRQLAEDAGFRWHAEDKTWRR